MEGLDDCQAYAAAFGRLHQAREQWNEAKESDSGGELLFAWMADECDFCAAGKLGEWLRDHFNLKTMAELDTEDLRISNHLKEELQAEMYTLRRQLENAEASSKRVELELQELWQKELERRADVEKAKRKAETTAKVYLECLRDELCIAKTTVAELWSERDGSQRHGNGEVEQPVEAVVLADSVIE